jgi:hypothetical protein
MENVNENKTRDYHRGDKINCFLDKEDYKLLREYAVERAVPMSVIIREAIHEYLMDNIPI